VRLASLLLLLCACTPGLPPLPRCEAVPTPAAFERVGPRGAGALLPNGDALEPMGERLLVGQSPLHLAVSPDDATVALAELGLDRWGVELLRIDGPLRRAQTLATGDPGGFLRGLAFSKDGATLYAANMGADRIEVLEREGQGWVVRRSFATPGRWPADLALQGDRLYVSMAGSDEILLYRTDGVQLARARTGGLFPHAILLAGDRLYVAEEGAEPGRKNRVEVFDADLRLVDTYAVGKNPAALALGNGILYVAASDDDWIDRIDLAARRLLQPFMLEQPEDPGAPFGLRLGAVQPGALALSPDGATLYVAAANLNAVLLVDARTGITRGALPAGWRPTALALLDGGKTLLVANYRGEGSRPSHASLPGIPDGVTPGSLQRISPIPEDLREPTAKVAALASRPRTEFAPPAPECERIGPLPARPGGDRSLSRIEHVIVVFKENKTFDEVFGDFAGARANRDYLLWGERYTPNQHELARRYCLLDNFYAESDISLEGHYWMTAQTSTDYFDRIYGAADGSHVRSFPLDKLPAGLAPIDTPRNGFIWDRLGQARVPYISFGEFVGLGGDLSKNIDLNYVDAPNRQLDRPDTEKLEVFLAYLRAKKLPAFSFVEMQWDHTFGVRPGKPAPDYMVADNDEAVGRLVEAVSKSDYWKSTLILVTEDDPASGADHVDRRRSFALVISPWARRGRVSSVRAAFPSLAATWERALGVAPVSRWDAAAEPLWDCLTGDPDFAPYTALPSNIAPRITGRGEPGEQETLGLDTTEVDRAPLGPALWRYMRPGEPMPRGILDRVRREKNRGPDFRSVLRVAAGAPAEVEVGAGDDD